MGYICEKLIEYMRGGLELPVHNFEYFLDCLALKCCYFKNVVNFAILFAVISVSILAFIDICRSESARFYPEDQDYGNATADFPESPQSARAAFGPPESWMEWVDSGYQGSGGSYIGIQFQDPQMPFVFWGGGQNGIYKYTGRYTYICPGKAIPPQLGLDKVYEGSGQRNELDSFMAFPFYAKLKVSDTDILNCRVTPSEWYTKVQIAKQFQERHATFVDRWRQQSARFGYRLLRARGEVSNLRCFKLRHDLSSKNLVYTIDTAVIGYTTEEGDIWYEDKDVRKISMKFEVPIEIRRYWKGLKEEDIDHMFNAYLFGTYLILNNGLYLRQID